MKRQAEIISHNNEVIRELHERVRKMDHEIMMLKPKAKMYDDIVAMVTQHETLQSIWDELVVAMKLIDSDAFNDRRSYASSGPAKA